MSGKWLLVTLWGAVSILVIVVDYILGRTAEYLNAHEIMRRTFTPEKVPTANRYLFCQEYFGPFALLAGWILFLIEAMAIALVLWAFIRGVRYIFFRG